MIHLECLGCAGHPLCRGHLDKMSVVKLTRKVEEATCPLCLSMIIPIHEE